MQKIMACFFVSALALISAGCASTDRSIEALGSYIHRDPEILKDHLKKMTAESCVNDLTQMTASLDRLEYEKTLQNDIDFKTKFERQARVSINSLFQWRMSLREKMAAFQKTRAADSCVSLAQGVDEKLRDYENFLGVQWSAPRGMSFREFYRVRQAATLFENSHKQLYTNDSLVTALPLTSLSELKTGDIVYSEQSSSKDLKKTLVKDVRLGWTHVGMVQRDRDDNLSIIEWNFAHGGSSQVQKMTGLDSWIQKERLRVAFFRFDDENLARKAAELAFASNRVKVRGPASLKRDGPGAYFHKAFQATKKAKGDGNFGDDLSADPRFHLVSEWRDFNGLYQRNLHLWSQNLAGKINFENLESALDNIWGDYYRSNQMYPGPNDYKAWLTALPKKP